MDSLVLGLRVLLAAVFAVAAVGKLRDLPGSRRALEDFGVPSRLSGLGSVALPLVELGIAATLVWAESARVAGVAAAALLGLFVGGIAKAMADDRAPECHCFGQLHSEPVGGRTLARNAVLIAMSGTVSAFGPGPEVPSWIGDRSAAELAVLAGAVVAIAALAPRAMRWSARRHRGERVRAGSPAPDFALATVDGGRRTLESLRAQGRPVLLVFVHPECGPCHALLTTLPEWRRRLAARLTIAVISDSGTEANRTLAGIDGIGDVLLVQERSEVYNAFGFRDGTPAAVVVDPDGTIASLAVSGNVAIEELIRVTLRRTDGPALVA